MEPQTGRSVSPLPATKQIGRLRKTTRRSRVHAQSVGLNAERKISRHRAEGELFLLTSPYIGRLRANSCVRQLRTFCFPGSSLNALVPSHKAAARFGSSLAAGQLVGSPFPCLKERLAWVMIREKSG